MEIQEFEFGETNEEIILTFYKQPIKGKQPELDNPDIKLKDPRTLIFNDFTINLFKPVNKLVYPYENTRYKLEITLIKEIPERWNSIDGKESHYDINELVYSKEEEESKEPQNMTDLFTRIYQKGDDNTKRAMNKSLEESKGTVLNTNWDQVATEKVKDPDSR